MVSAYGTQHLIIRKNSLQKIVQKLNFPEPTVPDPKLKIKAARTWCAAELLQVEAQGGSGAGLHHTYVSKLLLFKQARSSLLGVCRPRTAVSAVY